MKQNDNVCHSSTDRIFPTPRAIWKGIDPVILWDEMLIADASTTIVFRAAHDGSNAVKKWFDVSSRSS